MQFIRAVNARVEWLCLQTTNWTGSTSALLLSVLLVICWLVTGPWYHYSDTWQLVANTFTTLVAFMMLFVLQRAQNKHTAELHKKLDHIVTKLDETVLCQLESYKTMAARQREAEAVPFTDIRRDPGHLSDQTDRTCSMVGFSSEP